MENRRSILLQAKVAFLLILVNFLAQVPYFFYLYYRRQSFSVSLRSFLIMGLVFAVFLSGSILLFTHRRWGYPLMMLFLLAEFFFYLLNVINSAVHGFGLFFQIHNPDLILRVIYSIGYMNLFASGYFLYLLIRYRDLFSSKLPDFKHL